MYNYLNKKQDDNEYNSCKLVVDWLIVLLLLFTGDEYQGQIYADTDSNSSKLLLIDFFLINSKISSSCCSLGLQVKVRYDLLYS